MRAHANALVVLVTAGVLLSSCRSSTSLQECSGAIGVSVTTAYLPVFDWSPRCAITDVTVLTEPPAGALPAVMWDFHVEHPVGPRISYGTAPVGAQVGTPAQLLHAGVPYRVRVEYVVGGDAVAASGERVFTWYPLD